MIWLQLEQRKVLASFFSNMAVLFFGAALVSPVIVGVYSVVGLTTNLLNGIVMMFLSIKLVEETK